MSTRGIQAIRGMNDILPDADSTFGSCFEAVLRDTMAAYGYGDIRMPIARPQTDLFVVRRRVTDIVEKEMYTFSDDLGGDSVTLRPEGTAGLRTRGSGT